MSSGFFSIFKNLSTARFLFLLIIFDSFYSVVNAQNDSVPLKTAEDTLSKTGIDSLKRDSVTISDNNDFKSKVDYKSEDSLIFDLDSEVVFLYNSAEVKYEDMNLKANYMEVNLKNKIMYSTFTKDSAGEKIGIPDFAQKDDKFTADEMRYNFTTKKGKIKGVYTQQGEGYIHGETVKKIEDYEFIRNGLYSTCDLPHPHYGIMAAKLKVINNKKIITGPAYMIIEDVPMPFAIPFGFFPNKKGQSSGLIIPAYGESGDLGFYLKNGGYYFGFSDYVDFALTGDIYSKGSWATQFYSNYANRYHYNGNLNFTYSKIRISESDLPDFGITKQFFVHWTHSQDAKARPNSTFTANVNAGSLQNYRVQVSTPVDYLTNTFTSQINYSKIWAGTPYSFSTSLNHDQNSISRIVTVGFPQANFNVSRINPFERKQSVGEQKWYEKIGVSYNLSLLNQIRSPDSLLLKKGSEKNFQNGMQHQIPVSTNVKLLKFFTLTPSFNYNERWYLQTIEKRYDTEHDSVIVDTLRGFKAARNFSASASLNTRLYGMLQFRNSKIMALRHVFSPSVSFTYAPDFSAPSWHYYKTVQTDSLGTESKYSIFETGIFGGPGAGKQGVVNFNLDNNLEMKVRKSTDTSETTKKIKLLESLSINSSYNMAADSLRWYPVSINARTTLFEKVNLTGGCHFDPYSVDSTGRRRNISEWKAHNRLARFTDAQLSVGFDLSQASKKTPTKGSDAENNYIATHPGEYVDLDIPFSLHVDYSLTYLKPGVGASQTSQVVNFGGDLSLTPKWKIIFRSGYDFKLHEISHTSLSFYRDLHCWEMRLDWVPLGAFTYYNFQINVKASVLQDLKYIKKNDVYDR
ncbi:MAG TPA: putative LPS assembly protein LptD [Bacteroidia bacterium]|nr:putative LPS assembly protein LptD [Bacteroidia bacterium]